jgi:hypothetical protein
MARACDVTVTTLTSGSAGAASAVAGLDGLQPARIGARAASKTTMPTDGTRDGDMKILAPFDCGWREWSDPASA